MSDVMKMLAAASPEVGDDPLPSLDAVWGKLSTLEGRRGIRALSRPAWSWLGWGSWRRTMFGLAAVAVAVAVLVVGTAGSGPARAFAGWRAIPTPLASGQLQLAQSACQHDDPTLATLTPTVAEARGPFATLLYADATALTICTNGMPGGLVIGATGGTTDLPPIAPGQIGIGISGAREAAGQAFSDLSGPAGTDVTGVTLVLDDGSTIDATTANGWFVAWWPGLQGVASAQITTASGTTTQQLNLHSLGPPLGVLPGTSATGDSGARGTTN